MIKAKAKPSTLAEGRLLKRALARGLQQRRIEFAQPYLMSEQLLTLDARPCKAQVTPDLLVLDHEPSKDIGKSVGNRGPDRQTSLGQQE
ncbi:hypothetical protein PAT3040_01467 [Paenibacillus agaridevorans]|uniref:Uncharacterized protein n=1 Tax=Paenibacillus agaridevorans TaxID=171404 RepID=A0A2R5ELE9_9BACL|nr:hypothetical protein [Paenibacillus agaridevorans]GBG06925.1 hypothetical protein PAT3040_01467 [Paenibacillus agaridevorans]